MDYKNGLACLGLAATLGLGTTGCVRTVYVNSEEKPAVQAKATIEEKVENEKVHGISAKAREIILNSAVKIEARYTAEITVKTGDEEKKEIEPQVVAGSGVAVYDDELKKTYILTANHIIPSEEEECGSLFFMVICSKADMSSVKYSVDNFPAKVYKQNKTFDLALLEMESNPLPYTFKGKLAQSIDVGDLVAGAGFSRGESKMLHTGYVAGQDLLEALKDREEKEAKDIYGLVNDLNDIFDVPVYIVLDTHISPGDSGSGVYVLNQGVPELAGLAHVKFRKDGLGGITPLKVLRGFVDDTPIGDELLGGKK